MHIFLRRLSSWQCEPWAAAPGRPPAQVHLCVMYITVREGKWARGKQRETECITEGEVQHVCVSDLQSVSVCVCVSVCVFH